MEVLDFWDIKKQQKQLQDCNENERIISLGLFMALEQFDVGATTYIEKPSKEMLDQNTIVASKLSNNIGQKLVVSRETIDAQQILTVEDLIVKTLIDQQKQLKNYKRQIADAKKAYEQVNDVFEKYKNKKFSKREAIICLEYDCKHLCDIINR